MKPTAKLQNISVIPSPHPSPNSTPHLSHSSHSSHSSHNSQFSPSP